VTLLGETSRDVQRCGVTFRDVPNYGVEFSGVAWGVAEHGERGVAWLGAGCGARGAGCCVVPGMVGGVVHGLAWRRV
jgi:hypothetical protein